MIPPAAAVEPEEIGAALADAGDGSPHPRARDLALLHEVSRELVSILDRDELLQRVGELIKRLIDYQIFRVMLWDEEAAQLETTLSVRWNGCKSEKYTVARGRGLCGTAAELRRPVRVDDVREDPRYLGCSDDRVRSELVLPLLVKDRLLGVLDLESYRLAAFSAEDETLLATLAANVAVALENASLYERVKADERRLEADLATARETQRFLLPRSTPWVPGLQTAVAYCPARHLGGDLYDFLGWDQDRTAIAVGDVAGKGTGAALYGALAVGLLRGYVADNRCQPTCVLEYLNEELRQLEAQKRFLAMAFAIYDRREQSLTVANSGLPYPLLVRGGEVRELATGGLPLGAMTGTSYQGITLGLEPGDVVVFATDGIDECRGAGGEAFGSRRTRRALRELAGGSAQDIADGLLAATGAFLGGKREPSDDRTVVTLKVAGD